MSESESFHSFTLDSNSASDMATVLDEEYELGDISSSETITGAAEVSTSSLGKRKRLDNLKSPTPKKRKLSTKTQKTLLEYYSFLEKVSDETAFCRLCHSQFAFDSHTIERHKTSQKHQRLVNLSSSVLPMKYYFKGGQVKNSWCYIIESSIASGIIPRTLSNFLTEDVIRAIKNVQTPLTKHYFENYITEVRDSYDDKLASVLNLELPYSIQIDDSSTKDLDGVTHVLISNMEGCWLFSSSLSKGKSAEHGFKKGMDTIASLKLPSHLMMSACTDNAAAARKCAIMLTDQSHFGKPIRCAAHALNLIQQHFCDNLLLGTSLVIAVSNCLFGAGDLQNRRSRAKLKGISISNLHYCSTRWSSRIIVADSILCQWKELYKFFSEELLNDEVNERLGSLCKSLDSKETQQEVAIMASLVILNPLLTSLQGRKRNTCSYREVSFIENLVNDGGIPRYMKPETLNYCQLKKNCCLL